MKYTSLLRLATAFVAFSISAQSAEVFKVTTVAKSYPVAVAADFNGSANDIYNNVDEAGVKIPDVGNANGMSVTSNFNGDSSAVVAGFQKTQGSQTTTYFGPKFYAGVNRDNWHVTGGVCHNDGNGYRIKASTVSASVIGTPQVGVEGDVDYAAATGNGGNPLNTKVIFMFDADQSGLSGADDNLIFSDTDTLTAKLAVPPQMGPAINRASAASYRAMVKANGDYYAGTLYNVNLAEIGSGTTVLDMIETCAAATWTLMPNIVSDDNSFGVTNLVVDTSASATKISGKYLTNITQVGFLLETDTLESSGGYNYGVREFIAQATPASAPHPIEWSQDFASPVTILDGLSGLTGDTHAYTWSKSGGGLTATPTASTVTQSNSQVVLELNSRQDAGAVLLHMIGSGTDDARRVKPVSHETTFEIDLIEWKDGQADLLIRTRGHDGYVQSILSPGGTVKYSTWMADYTHTSFDNFSGPTRLRVNNNNNNSGVRIITGGTFDGSGGVTVDISAPVDSLGTPISGGVQATATVVMNSDNTAVEKVSIDNAGSGYISEPTVTFSGGGMTVAPTFSFNYSTGNVTRPSVVTASMRDTDGDGTNDLPSTLLNDGQILTYIQSYDNADDSISYYYSLDGSDPQLITKLTAAEHSPLGQGFYDFTTGNKYTTPNNRDAIFIQYKQWGNPGGQRARVGINSVSVATSDDDRDGVINRNDAFPSNPYETADSDSDNVGNNSDQYEGYNDGAVTTLASAISTAQALDGTGDAAGTNTFDYYVGELGYSSGGGAITQEAYDAVVNARDTAETALANAREARTGSTVIDVTDAVVEGVTTQVADITLTVEETSDASDWSSATTSDYTIRLNAPAGASFYRFTIPE